LSQNRSIVRLINSKALFTIHIVSKQL